MSSTLRNRLIFVTVLGGLLASYGAYSGMWPLMVAGILLVPLCFLRRR